MRLSLEDLPKPPPGKSGWPWTEAPDLPPDASSLPPLTLVTPTLNQARFLEETIRSVLLQGYPHLEYVILDGGSQDETREVLERYGPFVNRWRSAPDHGQAAAIAEGFEESRADLLAWLNSDDIYLPGALHHLGALAAERPRTVVFAAVQEVDEHGAAMELVRPRGITLEAFARFWEEGYRWHQAGMIFPRDLFEVSGGLDTSLDLVFDHDLVCRLLERSSIRVSDRPVACFRRHRGAKSHQKRHAFLAEMARVVPRYWVTLRPEVRDGCRRGLALVLARGVLGTLGRGRLREGFANLSALGSLLGPHGLGGDRGSRA